MLKSALLLNEVETHSFYLADNQEYYQEKYINQISFFASCGTSPHVLP